MSSSIADFVSGVAFYGLVLFSVYSFARWQQHEALYRVTQAVAESALDMAARQREACFGMLVEPAPLPPRPELRQPGT